MGITHANLKISRTKFGDVKCVQSGCTFALMPEINAFVPFALSLRMFTIVYKAELCVTNRYRLFSIPTWHRTIIIDPSCFAPTPRSTSQPLPYILQVV